MRLLQLYVEGFKTFAKAQTFDFTEYPEDGLCFVTGENQVDPELGANGAGKSSLWDAVCTALYSKTSRGLKAGDVASWQVAHELADKAEALAESGKKMTKKAQTPSVTTRLTFENYNGDVCVINRRWNPNVLTLQVGDGEPYNVDQAEIDSMVGYNFDEFLQAAYFSQFQDLFLDMGSTERSALVAKVLSLNVWDKYADNAKKDADAQKLVIEDERRAIERLKGQIEELEVQDLSEQIAAWDEEQQAELARLRETLVAHQEAEEPLRKAVDDATELQKVNKERVSDLEASQEASVRAAVAPLEAEFKVRVEEAENAIQDAEANEPQVPDDVPEYEKEIRTLSREESKLESELETLERDILKIDKKAEKVENLEGDCSACGQPITTEHVDHELDELSKQLNALEDQADATELALKRTRKALRKLEKDYADFDAEQREAEKVHKEAIKALRKTLSGIEAKQRTAIRAKEDEARADTLDALKEARDALSNAQSSLTEAKNALRDWNNDLVDIQADIEDCQDEKNPHVAQQEKNEKRLELLRADREEAFTALEQKVEDEAASRYWVRGFKSVKLFAVSNALNELEAEVNSALDGLGLGGWSVEFDVDKENKSGTLSKGFFAFISGVDNLEPVKWEAWSGGESQRLRLAASLGLANMIRSSKGLDLPFEIWDEPSQWMSDAGITGLLDVLQRRAKRLKRQIWLIDHRGLEHPFDAVVKVTKTLEGSTIANVTDTFDGAR